MKNPLLNLALATLALAAPALALRAQDDADKPKVLTKAQLEARESRAKAAAARAQTRAKAKAEAKANALDINKATKEELIKGLGIQAASADAIIAKRPYKTKADLVVKGALPMATYQGLREKVAVK
jgi:DNA uptake protein ComE-like DNA-binding protein